MIIYIKNLYQNKNLYQKLLLVVLVITLVFFFFTGDRRQIYEANFLVFGTKVEIKLIAKSDAQANKAFVEVEDDFKKLHRQWHSWEEGGLLAKINKSFADSKEIEVGPAVVSFFQKNMKLAAKTDYMFEPGMGHLYSLWGWHATKLKNPPSSEKVKQILESKASIADVVISNNKLASLNPMLKVDFGASAKGYFLDRAMVILARNGISSAMVSIGGDLQVLGKKPRKRFQFKSSAWSVGIKNPVVDADKKIIASVKLNSGENIFTSGIYERFFEYNGTLYGHIIDPQSGQPVAKTLAVTVIHEDGVVADVAATALMVSGTARWKTIIKNLELDKVLLIDSDMKWHVTPEMHKRIVVQ